MTRTHLPIPRGLQLVLCSSLALTAGACACKCPDPASLRGGASADAEPAELDELDGDSDSPAAAPVADASATTAPPADSAVASAPRVTPTADPGEAPAAATVPDPVPSPDGAVKAPDAGVKPQCAPRGQPPYDYAAPAVAEKPRIDLTGPWKWGKGWPNGVETLAFDDSEATAATVPGITRINRDGKKQTRVWLRHTFDVQRAAYFRSQGLDLGGRYGASVVFLNGKRLPEAARNAPIYVKGGLPLVDGKNVIAIQLEYSKFLDGIFWYGAPALGKPTERQRGLLTRRYTSKVDGKPHELSLFVPRCADLTAENPLIVALPGWSGNAWSYAGARLLREADARGYLVLTPETFGNILYTGASEDGVLEALDLVTKDLKIDPNRIYLTGLSMGGAGALQISYHYPDRFAAVAAFYGDSQYNLGTGYIGRILGSKANGDRYSVINFPENARNLPVLLVHAKDDKTSPFRQSSQLAKLDAKLRLPNHRLIAPKRGGHTLDTVDAHTEEAMAFFDAHSRQPLPTRVTFRTNSSRYVRAYWVTLKTSEGDDFTGIDASWDPETATVHIARIEPGISAVDLDVPARRVTAAGAVGATVTVKGRAIEVGEGAR